MSYASLSDLRDFLPRYDITDLTKPSATQATAYLARLSSRLDGLLSARGYSIPVVGAQSVEILRDIVLTGAGYWATRIMFPGNTNGLVIELRDEYLMVMQELRNGTIALPDAPTDPSNVALDQTAIIDPNSWCNDWYETHPFVRRSTRF